MQELIIWIGIFFVGFIFGVITLVIFVEMIKHIYLHNKKRKKEEFKRMMKEL